MENFFYRAFEEKYRGSRELIRSRLLIYLPFIHVLLKEYPNGQALDLGCGRGEWLELLSEQGFNAQGVDLDDGMLQDCRERGLQVETAEALTYMQALPAGSLCIVSGFHIAEHLPFKDLQRIVMEAKRVLVDGGLLILETPNPENISVGTNSFYLDPTHERPIPQDLLSFLPELYGYERCKVLRLQESAQLHGESHLRLMHVLNGVSPDYAVIAQTQGSPSLIEALTPAFNQDFGLSLEMLAERYQQKLDYQLMSLDHRLISLEQKAHEAEVRLNDIYTSNCWRITAPLRWAFNQWRLLRKDGVINRSKAFAKKIIRKATQSNAVETIFISKSQGIESDNIAHLSPCAKKIFTDLNLIIRQQKKGD
jgi:SAM-dependent methyltransferase